MGKISSGNTESCSMSRRRAGAYYESIARKYLEQHGLRFISSNVSYPIGEIDLIMVDLKQWVFVEVRYRQNAYFGDAAATVTLNKQKKLLRAAGCWLMARDTSFDSADCRFDVVAITGKNLVWLPNAFHG